MERDEIEKMTCSVSAGVLALPQVAPHESLSSLGATSLSMLQILASLEEKLALTLTPEMIAKIIFEHDTPATLATFFHSMLRDR